MKKFWDSTPRPSEYQSDALTTEPLGPRQRSGTSLYIAAQVRGFKLIPLSFAFSQFVALPRITHYIVALSIKV